MKLAVLGATVMLLIAGSAVRADSIWTGSSGPLSAGAVFHYDAADQTLSITLSNTGAVAASGSDVLTAIFFDYSGTLTLTKANGSAAIGDGSKLYNAYIPPGGKDKDATWQALTDYSNWITNAVYPDLSGEYAFKTSVNGFDAGISSSGLSPLFGKPDVFDDTKIIPFNQKDYPDGSNFGLIPTPQLGGSVPSGLVQNVPFVSDSAKITFTNVASFNESGITRVRFQFGTGLTEPSFDGSIVLPSTTPVPLPASFIGVVTLLGSLAAVRKIRSRRAA